MRWRNPKSVWFALLIPWVVDVSLGAGVGDTSSASPNLVRDVPACVAEISVDSSFAGYGTDVLADGRWIDKGREPAPEGGHPDRLGNGGNTWVSQDAPGEHWIRLDWPHPVEFNEIEICWSRLDWRPKAFRIEGLADGRWQPIDATVAAWAPTDRRSVISVPQGEFQSLRVVQPAGCGGARDLMAAQEVAVYLRGEGPRQSLGVRRPSALELERLTPDELTPNIARLHEQWPGASLPVAFTVEGTTVPAAGLADGDRATVAEIPRGALAVGVEWPVAHVADQVVLSFTEKSPPKDAMVLETHDGDCWVAVHVGPSRDIPQGQRSKVWTFEPLATRAIRARFASGRVDPLPAEIEVRRYLPPGKDVWPDRLVRPGGLQREMLAGKDDPSFEALSQCALSMTPVRAFVGLKDGPDEIGVAWDGTLMGREAIRFRFGESRYRLTDGRDTLRRTLLDGWRPGVVIEARLDDLEVRQTVFSVAAGDSPTQAVVMIRVRVKNLTGSPLGCPIEAEAAGDRPGGVVVADRTLRRGDDVVLIARTSEAVRQGDGDIALQVDLTLSPHGEGTIDFVHPHAVCPPGSELLRSESPAFDAALAQFRAYWDEILAGAVRLEVPEARVERMYRAVLAQLFINADGDVMPYGAAPSVYDGNLYGIEESYAMLGLGLWGFSRDAQRYLDATYLTPQFLRKVEKYSTYPDRHQQYRNGLEPHYAVSAYRLSRDRDWIGKHVPLVKECAEWTMRERRTTMQREEGRKPLHGGLLPKWSYGGDIHDVQCYALFGNLCCWRGLVDTAWLLEELGDPQAARRYAEEAALYRADIERAMDGSYQQAAQPPFLPLRLYADRPDEQMDYYQLFAGCILEVDFFAPGSRRDRWITDFLEADNRTFCFLPRFRRDAGAGGLDALYGKGYVLGKLREDAIREFLLGFYAFLAFNLDHETFISRETNVIYASDVHVRSSYRVPDVSDPVPCSSAVALHFLRHLLVTEEPTAPEESPDGLLLLPAVPRAWLRDGKQIRFDQLPTYFGPVSLEVRSAVAEGRIEARCVPPDRQPPRAVKLRLRHPEFRPIRSVTVNGRSWDDFDRDGEWVVLPRAAPPCDVVVSY
ncbi:MAG TPA: discoidin domain-containing protein [Thermoguttaceae bacterium]|nr:discoidin domain-containing protein [Thermoguttaceae bacterium]